MNTIGEAMRAGRVRAGLTIRQVGRLIGAGESQISNWERGKVDPGREAVRKYVTAGLISESVALLPFHSGDAA